MPCNAQKAKLRKSTIDLRQEQFGSDSITGLVVKYFNTASKDVDPEVVFTFKVAGISKRYKYTSISSEQEKVTYYEIYYSPRSLVSFKDILGTFAKDVMLTVTLYYKRYGGCILDYCTWLREKSTSFKNDFKSSAYIKHVTRTACNLVIHSKFMLVDSMAWKMLTFKDV